MIHTVGGQYSDIPVGTGKWSSYIFLDVLPRCAVPLFIMISGILLIGHETSGEKVRRNVKKALVLLVVWNIAYIILQAVLWGGPENVWQQIISLPVKPGPSGHLWYSYFLVWMYLFSPTISALYRVLSERMRFYFVLLAVVILGVLDLYLRLLGIANTSTLYSLQIYMTLNYIGMMFLGRLIYERAIHWKRPAVAYACTAVLAFGALLAVTDIYYRSHGNVTFMMETQLLPVLYGAGLLGLASEYRDRLQKVTGFVRQAVEWLARHALGIYFIHCINLWMIGSIRLGNITISANNNALQSLLLCGVYYAVSLIEVALMDRIPFLRKLVT